MTTSRADHFANMFFTFAITSTWADSDEWRAALDTGFRLRQGEEPDPHDPIVVRGLRRGHELLREPICAECAAVLNAAQLLLTHQLT